MWASGRISARDRVRMNQSRDGRTRVLFVNTKRRPPLGADTWIHLEIMRELDRSRFDVHAACVAGPRNRPTPTYRRLREIRDVTIRKVDFGREVAGQTPASKLLAALSLLPAGWSVLRLAGYIRRQGISIIHTADRPRDALAAVLLGRITGATCIVHVHVGYDPSWMRGILQWAIHRAGVLIAISDFVADTLRDGGCDPESIQVVKNGIEFARWTPGCGRDAVREELGIAGSTPVVVTACRLFRAKGVTELVDAVHQLRREVPDAVLLVVGKEMEYGYLAELRSQVHRYGLGDRVRFLGHRDDMVEVMAAADVFAMPSRDEPFGLVYAEAMAMELPVVGLDSGGTVEVVEHGVSGLLSAAGDTEALAGNLRALLVDPERRREYGSSGRRRVETFFTTQRMAADTAAVYDTVS